MVFNRYLAEDKPHKHYYRVSYNISKVPSERIIEIRKEAIRKFYFSPVRIFRYIWTTPFKHGFWTKVKMMVLYFLGGNPEDEEIPL